MTQMEYIGLLNTDKSKGPVQMFIQGRGTHERYVLDRLPPWIEASLKEAHETGADVRYFSGANLRLLSAEARQALHTRLRDGQYKVRRIAGGDTYLAVGEVFSS
jgi:hypothetical protein